MSGPLAGGAGVVARRPGLALVLLLAVSAGLGSFTIRLEQRTSFEAFAPPGGAAAALADVREDFGAAGTVVQLLIDAGSGGDILSTTGIEATGRIADTVADAVGDRAARPQSPVRSFAGPIRIGLEAAGAADDPSPEVLSQVVTATLESPAGSQIAGLLSEDLDVRAATARAGLAIVELSPELSRDQAVDAALDVRRAVDGLDLDGVTVGAFGQPLLENASSQLVDEELPRLLGLSVVLITIVLALVYRNIADVAIGLVGLGLALTWTYGIGALLGPGWLGWTGPFNQITTVVPILVAGLGIDFALHLTTRRREERTERRPRRASRVTLVTVGGALALTTVTTAVGFLTNIASPLPPIEDFGIFTAAGVLSSFVVMVVLIPSARTLLDRWRHRGGPTGDDGESGDSGAPLPLVGSVARLAVSHPIAVLAGTLLVSAMAIVAGLSVPTRFDPDDFVPSDSRVATTLDEVEQLFGADVSERTYVVLDGPLATVEAARALAEVPDRLTDIEAVRTGAGRALVDTSITLLEQLTTASPENAERFSSLGWSDGRLADDADVGAIYDTLRELAPERADRVIEPGGDRQLVIASTSAGQDGAEALVDEVDERLEPLHEAGVGARYTSQALVFSRTVDAMTDSQLRSIAITVGAAAALLVTYFWWRVRSSGLGGVAMVPTLLVATWVVGSMWVLGLSFNVLTITIGSLAIAIGVDYGIHIAYRFREEQEARETDEAIRHTVEQTGGALAGSAATTAVGFGVLMLSSIVPIRQFGMITAMTIVYSVVAAVLVVPAILHLWWTRRAA